MTYAYVRVSTLEQKVERQLDSLQAYAVDHIFTDKQSGKNFDRAAYKKMKRIIKKGDLLILHSIDRLGRNYTEVLKEWREINQEIGCDIVVLDMPLLDTRSKNDVTGALISDIVLQLLAYIAQKERENMMVRQAEGIAAARARGTYNPGRPRLPAEGFEACYNAVQNGNIQVKDALKRLGISRSSWYNWVKNWEKKSTVHPSKETRCPASQPIDSEQLGPYRIPHSKTYNKQRAQNGKA